MALPRKQIALALVLLGLLAAASSGSSLKPGEVPTFRLRARATFGPAAAPPAGFVFTLRVGAATSQAKPAEWSGWMSYDAAAAANTLKGYPAQYIERWPVITLLRVEGVIDPTRVEAELQFDEGGPAIAISGELFGATLGIVLWRDETKKPHAASMATFNEQYWKALAGVEVPENERPKRFPIVDRFIGGDDDRRDWREGIAGLSRAGFSAIGLPPSQPIRELLKETGVGRTACAVYSPPGYVFPMAAPGSAAPQPLAAWAKEQAAPYRAAGYDLHDVSAFALSDEPGWYYPGAFKILDDPAAAKVFHDYLQAQGLSPADVGATGWESVKPLGRSAAMKDLPSRRLYYWTMRFFPWWSTTYFAEITRAMEEAFYPGMPLTTNFNFFAGRLFVPGPVANNADKQSPDAAMGGHDWLEFGRLRGCTTLWTEDWFPDSQAYQWSFYAAKLRCAAEKGGVSFGGYVVPRAAGDHDDGLEQKILCLVGSGGKAVNTYVFGPEYNFPGNCYSDRPQLLRQLAKAFRMIGAAEDLLWDGRRPRPQIAILSPRSALMWDAKRVAIPTQIQDATNTNLNGSTVDYQAEVADLYLALQHANVPANFVEEEDLSPKGLAAYRILYATEPNIPAEIQKSLAAWVREGGTLVTVSGAGALDRYDEPCSTLAELTGMNEKPRERLEVADLASLKKVGTVTGADNATCEAYGVRGTLVSPAGQVLATFDDGSPAIVRHTVGGGKVIHFAFLPGLSYARSSTATADKLPIGFSAALRTWIVAPSLEFPAARPVEVATPLVETPLLLSKGGAAITLLNWTGAPIARLDVHAHLPFTVKSARSVKRGELTFTPVAEGVTLAVPLDATDILLLRP